MQGIQGLIEGEEYLTVSEFSERCGTSKQAVYARLNKSLKPYLKIEVEDGVKKISTRALYELYGFERDTGTKQESKSVEQGLNNQLIDLLNKQLIQKDRQIENLEQLLFNMNAQLTESQHRIQALMDKSQEEQQNVEIEENQQSIADKKRIIELEQEIERLEEESKKKWWQKLFGL